MDTLKIRVIMEYEYRRGSNAAQAARNINDVYGLTLQTNVPPVIGLLASVLVNLKNEPRGRPKTLVDNDELKATVEADDTQSMAELAAAFDVSVKTVLVHLRQIGKCFCRQNPSVPEKIEEYGTSLWSSNYFNEDNNTIILIHGHGGSARTIFNTLITDNILKYQEPHNIIVMDWEKDASYSYSVASSKVPFVARDLEYFLNIYFRNVLRLSKVHLVGFGLGAHLAGIGSRWASDVPVYEDRVGRITGLDPSGSGWGTNSQRLRSTDADYVEVIHTDGSGLLANGIGTAIGHINFYANGGSNQPGCLTHTCSHNRAYELFAASMVNPHLVAYPCSSTTQMNLNRCGGTPLHIGGTEMYKRSSSSIYRINTNRNYPF